MFETCFDFFVKLKVYKRILLKNKKTFFASCHRCLARLGSCTAYGQLCIYTYTREVGSSPKYIRKNPARQIQKNLKNIVCYSCYESSKGGKCDTFLVSYSYLFHRIQVLLCYAVQDIFEDYSSKRAKRSAA